MLKAQEDMLSKLASLLEGRNLEHGKAPEQMTGEPLYPPGFTSVQSQNVQGTSVPTKVHIDPVGVVVNLQPGPSSHPKKENDWVHKGRSAVDPLFPRKLDRLNIAMGTVAPPQNDNRQGARDPRRGRPQFDPIPVTYKELFHDLYDRHLVSPYHVVPIQPPYPKWYDANVKCDYHGGNPGHSIENCTAFKKVVQALRRRNVINFGDSEQQKVAQNPLPNHAGAGINTVVEEKGKRIVMDVSEVESPMLWVWCQMVKVGLLKPSLSCDQYSSEEVCHYHNCAGHNIQQCPDFLKFVQGLMDKKEIEFFKEVTKKEKAEICASEGSSKGIHSVGCPIVITPKNQVNERVAPSTPFPYKDSKQVPWRYDCQMREGAKQQEEINEVGHLTRSGRFFFKEPEKKIAAEKGKNVDVQIKEDKLIINELGSKDETMEFLKILKHSEFGVVEQLHKLSASISILSLLLSSEAHRNVLIKVLDQTFVSKELPTEKLERLVAKMQADNIVSFSKDEIPSGMIDNHKALHITVRCKGHVLSRVLISDGSALNVIPLVTLKKLPVDSTLMRNCQGMVRSFDGTESEAGAVSSTLHQRLKFVFDGRLVCIHAEEDIIASVPAAPYVEVEEQAVECPFKSFDNATFVAEGKKISEPRSSYYTKTGHKLTLGRGTKGSQGLGRQLQGPVGPNYPIAKRDRFGLGYRPTLKEKQRGINRNQELGEARLTGEDPS
ncbi:uncharacterized protein LOC120178982 [Hibiscus syriacus]|uniref:uncharacterized protein LOC120178982 n=1 Tax=Hibiscus syriacus TaxID=106335 RepID=UPI001920859F|nr:uncharacterized protein LOC120178982 [Hibiscus syriacus]